MFILALIGPILFNYLCIFFNCYLAAPRSTLGHSQEGSLTNLMLITAFKLFQAKGHR